jgi:hypothetical protein
VGAIVLALQATNHPEEIDERGSDAKEQEDGLKRHSPAHPLIQKIANAIPDPDAGWEHDANGKQISQVLVFRVKHLLW